MKSRTIAACGAIAIALCGGFACGMSHDGTAPPDDGSSDATTTDAGHDAITDDASLDHDTAQDTAPEDAPVDAASDTAMGSPDVDAPASDGASCVPGLLSTEDAGGACNVIIQNWSDEGHTHLPEGTAIAYCTVPPSSGPHYPVWANFQTYDRPVAHGYLVHSMEHGAVILWYQCANSTDCPAVAARLQSIIDAHPLDPMCSGNVKSRLILVPDPTLDVPIAASAWTWTYRASCIDTQSLTTFINGHYDQGTEHTCAAGIVPP